MRIPFGETVSYAELARRIGQPRADRAVAQACGKNPLPIVIPCHRVIRSDGTIGGYSGGIRWKQRLLRFERELL
jgi:methylated-DNA-[protein]-cysteine S-methyltransferase